MSIHVSSADQTMAGILGFWGTGGLEDLGGIGYYIKRYGGS
jgi:hypothetical protein